MKKTKIIAGLLSAVLLSSCSLFGGKDNNGDNGDGDEEQKKHRFELVVTGGTEDEQEAIRSAADGSIVMVNASALQPDSAKVLYEDNGDYVQLEKTKVARVNKVAYTVSIEWSVDQTQAGFKELLDNGQNSNFLYPAYKGYEHKTEQASLSFSVGKLTCGGATCVAPEALKYTCTVQNSQIYYDDLRISQINGVTEQEKVITAGGNTYHYPSTFNMVNYEDEDGEKYNPYFKVHENNKGVEDVKQYYYCNVPGEVIYLSPDGNWGLIAEGNQVLELYAGSAYDLNKSKFPYLEVGKKVIVSGNLSQYCGNIQLGFITKVAALEGSGKFSDFVSASKTFGTIDASVINSWKLDSSIYGTCQKQAIDGFSNSLQQVTGTPDASTLKDRDGKSVTVGALQNNRFTFTLNVSGGESITVAYDYHTDKSGSVGLFNALKAALSNGGSVTIKGTMRYNGRDEGGSPFVLSDGNTGVWNIVPFELAHVA